LKAFLKRMVILVRHVSGKFSTRLILMTMIAGLLPILIFIMILSSYESVLLREIDESVHFLRGECIEKAGAISKILAEDRIRQKAVDVASQLALFVDAHGDLTAGDLQRNRKFRDIAIQPVGETGYTAVHESGVRAFSLTHRSPAVENTNLREFEKENPDFWSIVREGLDGKNSSGYYDWRDDDGVVRRKFMHVEPVAVKTADGVTLSVAATTYVDEFSRPVEAVKSISEKFSEDMLTTVGRSLSSFKKHGFLLFIITAFMTFSWSVFTGVSLSGVLGRLREAIGEINQGNFSYRMHPEMSGDVRDIMIEFNTMASRLEDTVVSRSKLEESEAALTSIIDFLPDPTFAIDRRGIIIFWNRAMEELTGVRRRDIRFQGNFEHALHYYGKKRPMLLDYLLSPDLEYEKNYSRIHKERDIIIAEGKVDLPAMGPRWIWGKASSIFNTHGQLIGAIESLRDITDRKELEEALKQSEERFRTAVMHSGIGMALIDIEGRFIMVNPMFCTMLGYSEEEISRKDMAGISHPEDLFRDRLLMHRLLTGEIPSCQMEKRFIHKDGPLLWTLLNVTLFRSPSGEPLHFIAQVQDITERKKTEAALGMSESMLRAIVDSARDAIFVKDMDMKYTQVNHSMVDLFGKPASEIIGMSDGDLFGAVNAERIGEVDRQVLQGRTIEEESEKPVRGTMRIFHTIKVPFRDGEGRIVGLCGIARDVTERKRLEGQLFQSQKMEAIGTLAGGIAHDFNNLLMGIQGYASLVMMDLDPDHPHYERLKSIESQVRSGADLSRQLLGFARGGKYDIRLTDMNDLIGKTAAMFGRTRKEIRIHEDFDADLRTVAVDRNQMEQALLNLFVNAWQAMPAGGDLCLETRNVAFDGEDVKPYHADPGDYVMIAIRDSGTGMDEKTKSRIFEPFFTTKEMGRGTGLGLATVYGIVKGYGGFIQVDSESGQGSAFRIFIPAAEGKPSEEKPSDSLPPRGKETILVVDDEEVILDVVDEWLTALGYHVIIVDNGAEAIEIFQKRRSGIDLVVLDMIMPGMSGGEVIDRLKALGSEVPVILSSGYSVEGEASKIMKRGVEAFIQKPFHIKDFSRLVREVLDRKNVQ